MALSGPADESADPKNNPENPIRGHNRLDDNNIRPPMHFTNNLPRCPQLREQGCGSGAAARPSKKQAGKLGTGTSIASSLQALNGFTAQPLLAECILAASCEFEVITHHWPECLHDGARVTQIGR